MMCRERSKRAQFIMVTLRKVSLSLADHHIGITHGGDGCSRRILDFNRERAMELGEEALKQAEQDAKTNHSRILDAQAANSEMPRVPEALPTPQSLGGLLPHMQDSSQSIGDDSMNALTERATEMKEHIVEQQSVQDTQKESELIEHEHSIAPIEE